MPPGERGWHLHSRPKESKEPRTGPWSRMQASAYAEHVGWKRHCAPRTRKTGLSTARYTRRRKRSTEVNEARVA